MGRHQDRRIHGLQEEETQGLLSLSSPPVLLLVPLSLTPTTQTAQRPSRESERQFEAKVEDFFREATCAGYGRQVFDLYQLKKQKAAPLTTQDTVFTKLDPTGGVKVLKTKAKS